MILTSTIHATLLLSQLKARSSFAALFCSKALW